MRGNTRHWTAEQDAALIAASQSPVRGARARLSRIWNIPQNCLTHRAQALGLPPTRRTPVHPRRWLTDEDRLLIEYGHLPRKALQARLAKAGFKRSTHSLENRRAILKQQGHPVGQFRERLTVSEIMDGFNCSNETVQRWIRCGALKARALCPDSKAKYYEVTYAALRQFCLDHVVEIARLHPDLIWYTDLIGCPIKGE